MEAAASIRSLAKEAVSYGIFMSRPASEVAEGIPRVRRRYGARKRDVLQQAYVNANRMGSRLSHGPAPWFGSSYGVDSS